MENKIHIKYEEVVWDKEDLEDVLSRITMINTVLDFKWEFHIEEVSIANDIHSAITTKAFLVYVSFERPDTETGKIGRGKGRKEIIYSGSTVSSVVKTAWLLIELMVRHELMEGFRYDNCRIFNPHHRVEELADIERKHRSFY